MASPPGLIPFLPMKNFNIINSTTIVMAVLAIAAFVIAYSKGRHLEGLAIAKNMIWQILPLILLAFIVAGMLQVIIPQEQVAKWIGEDSGFKGIITGTIIGAFLPGGPYVTLPVVVGFAKLGASVPVLVAMITGWSLIAVMRLPMEFGILGPRLTLIRLGSTFLLAPVAGLIAKFLMKVLKL